MAGLLAACSPAPLPPPAPVPAVLAVPRFSLTLEARGTPGDRGVSGLRLLVDDLPARSLAPTRWEAAGEAGRVHRWHLEAPGRLPLDWSAAGSTQRVQLAKSRLRLVALGDSLTTGLKLTYDEAYPRLLKGLLETEVGGQPRVLAHGRVGDTWALAHERLGSDVYPTMPDVVLVVLGTNDTATVPLDTFSRDVDELLTPLIRLGALVVIVDVPTRARFAGDWNERIAPYNAAMALAARSRGLPLVALSERFRAAGEAGRWDLFTHEQPYDLSLPATRFQGDVHPNAQGHREIARAIADTLVPLLASRVR